MCLYVTKNVDVSLHYSTVSTPRCKKFDKIFYTSYEVHKLIISESHNTYIYVDNDSITVRTDN